MRIYINNRDLLTWPRAMAEKLEGQGHEVVWIDNNSSYPPLMEYYRKHKPRLILLGENLGANAPWWGADVGRIKGTYVVTDPDLDLSHLPADWPEVLEAGLFMYPEEPKCGLGLEPCPNGFHAHEVDTTFALYRPGIKEPTIGGHSVGPPYAVRHLPDYLEAIDSELDYYLRNARGGGRYSTNKERLLKLPVKRDIVLASKSCRERRNTGEE